MPHSCCVPGCRGNYRNGPKVRVYSFPSEDSLRNQWIRAIKREDFTVTPHSKVNISPFCLRQYCFICISGKKTFDCIYKNIQCIYIAL